MLEELALAHDLPRLILEWRALQKLKGTYIDALPQLVNPETGRVHTCFNQAVAATGRLSSSDPNLQNIPIRTELGREIRRAFIADPGHVLISADYSQIELRVLAHLSDDAALIDAFQDGRRHPRRRRRSRSSAPTAAATRTSCAARAKMVNYALLYGKTAFTLAKDIGVTPQAAQEFIDAYFAGFPRVRAFIDRTLEEARVVGRREDAVRAAAAGARADQPQRPDPIGRRARGREHADSGTAADIMKRAMIDVHARARGRCPDARMILTVHDELLFEVPEARRRRGRRAGPRADAGRGDAERAADGGCRGSATNWKEAKR